MKLVLVITTAVGLVFASSGAATTHRSNAMAFEPQFARSLPLRTSPTYEGWEIAGIVRSGAHFTTAPTSDGPLRALVP
jgi:hypothetical protein